MHGMPDNRVSGLGTSLLAVVAGRVIAGFGGGGMMALILILIAGKKFFDEM